jgi:hypothetical protein
MNRSHTSAAFWFGEIRLLSLVILCVLAVSNMGCDGGVGEAVAVDEVAADAAATAATDAAADVATAVVTETAIEGSTDVALDLAGDLVTVEPFTPALDGIDNAEDVAVVLSEADPDGTSVTEFNAKATGELQLMAITTRSIFQVEKAYLDVQNKRLIVQAIENRGEPPTWGFFKLGDKAVSDLQRTKQLELTGSEGKPMVFGRTR